MGKEQKIHTWYLIGKKLAGEASAEELQELESLLREYPELHYPLQTLTDLWGHSGPEDRRQAEAAFERHIDRMQGLKVDFSEETDLSFPDNNNKRRRISLLAVSAAAVFLAAGALFFFFRPAPKSLAAPAPANKVFAAKLGSRLHMTLPDGSKVWLNADSRIRYAPDFGSTQREVYLTGEAYFDVTKNPEKPFVIHTDRVDIRVLGTVFNVKSYPDDKTTETTLIGGSVEVAVKNRPTEKIILRPDEKLVIANDDSAFHTRAARNSRANVEEALVSIKKPTYQLNTGAIIETEWVHDKLVFQDEPFSVLAERMQRWYNVEFHFSDPRLEQLRFTGIFSNETINQAMDALKLTGPATFSYSIQDNSVTINEK